MGRLTVLLTGASADHLNRNRVMRDYVSEGFRALPGLENVLNVPLESAAQCVRKSKPAIVLCFGSCMPDSSDYVKLRHACDGAGSLLAFWVHDDPYEFDFHYKMYGVADYIFTNDKWAALHYDCKHAYHLPLAASKSAHWRPLTNNKDIDIFFCGVGFENRIRLISDLSKVLQRYKAKIVGDEWPVKKLPFAKNDRISHEELINYYSNSLITINTGRTHDYANRRYELIPSTPGPRTFEAGMAGTAQLYFVEGLEIEEYYVPGKEIILFDTVQEFERIIAEFADDRRRAAEISAAAQKRTLRDHTYYHRALKIIDTLKEAKFKNGPSPGALTPRSIEDFIPSSG